MLVGADIWTLVNLSFSKSGSGQVGAKLRGSCWNRTIITVPLLAQQHECVGAPSTSQTWVSASPLGLCLFRVVEYLWDTRFNHSRLLVLKKFHQCPIGAAGSKARLNYAARSCWWHIMRNSRVFSSSWLSTLYSAQHVKGIWWRGEEVKWWSFCRLSVPGLFTMALYTPIFHLMPWSL